MITTDSGLTIAEDHEITAGMIATHYCGTDSYVNIVTGVERYKSGARKGLIKAIIAAPARKNENDEWVPGMRLQWSSDENSHVMEQDNRRYLPTMNADCTWHTTPQSHCHTCREAGKARYLARSDGRVAWWSELKVGYGIDHRDPHF